MNLLKLLARRYFVITVVGDSMSPTMANGQRWLARRTRGRIPPPGALLVFANPPDTVGAGPPYLVKRAVAVPGDPVPADVAARVGAGRVPAGQVVVRGDNPRSRDSRHFGYVPADAVLGVAERPLQS
ncbi:S26 family signal peptidase [Actinoplanes missouriensis]|uniref:S26 family signal peptidase n=1 Tax=Actinoplanes missouriensis TaxID=1866 RepID=UPI00340859E3